MSRLKQLAEEIHRANIAYHGKDRPIMPDAAYDALRREYKRLRKSVLLNFAARFQEAAEKLHREAAPQPDLFA